MTLTEQMTQLAKQAKAASRELAKLTTEQKNLCLLAMAEALQANAPAIEKANALDMEAAAQAGLSKAMLDRLKLDAKRIDAMAKGLREVAALPDPVGRILDERTRPNGLRLRKVATPLGVVVIIFESRPNVTADAAGLCFKSGNATILRGGKEAIHSNQAIVEIMIDAGRRAISPHPALSPSDGERIPPKISRVDPLSVRQRSVGRGGTRPYQFMEKVTAQFPEHAIQLVQTTDRAAIKELLSLTQYIDLCMPRGGEGLIRAVAECSKVPVIKHYKGVCHVYVDGAADPKMAEDIIVNAKLQRPGVCNAMETLLVDAAIASKFLPSITRRLSEKNVELHVDEASQAALAQLSPPPRMRPASEQDWSTEYNDYVMNVRVVQGVTEAIAHINAYGSAHSDSIVTTDAKAAEKFLQEVDSATVYWNASTRFTDGGEFGMGAEIGISTDKIGARGPMGLEELTTYKWMGYGTGQIRT